MFIKCTRSCRTYRSFIDKGYYQDLVFVIAAEAILQNLVWLLKIYHIKELIRDSVDEYGHQVTAGFCAVKGRYLEEASEKSIRINYCTMKKKVFVLKETVEDPFMDYEPGRGL